MPIIESYPNQWTKLISDTDAGVPISIEPIPVEEAVPHEEVALGKKELFASKAEMETFLAKPVEEAEPTLEMPEIIL